MSYQTIRLRELETLLDQRVPMQLLDTRRRNEFDESHIIGAVNIPFEEMEEKYETLTKNLPVVVYCARGGQSMRVSALLQKKGYCVVNVASGYAYYQGKYRIRGNTE